MKINLFGFFRKGNNLQKVYPYSGFEVLSKPKNVYPFFLSLEYNNVYAYSSRFMVKPGDVEIIENIVGSSFRKKITKEKECLHYKEKALHYFKFNELGQTAIDIITNDNYLIKSLCSEHIEPPAPDTVFPYCDFGSVGSLQGQMEMWWNVYWSPFWISLSEEEKANYLERNNISSELREFLILHG
ncbi:hypothetical protein [Enterobacter mori]|uniref:hypothetical protein n=1 Tax=Enterobacter mori TaxID=539813 RepID=UPI00301949F7